LSLQMKYTVDRHLEFLPLKTNYENALKPAALQKGSTKIFRDDYITPSFISVVYPFPRFSLGLSRITNIYMTRHYQEDASFSVPGLNIQSYQKRKIQGEAYNYGLTAAYAITPDLYIGGSLRYIDAYFRSMTKAIDLITVTGSPTLVDRPALANFDYEDKDWALGYNIGMLWKCHKWFTLGAVYKSPAKLRLDAMPSVAIPEVKLQLPSTYGIGLAFHPNKYLRLAMDVDYIKWHDFDKKIRNASFDRNNTTNFHIGGEYFIDRFKYPIFLRTGYMLEESNRLYYKKNTVPALKDGFPEGDPLHHLTCGFGLVFEKFQIDFAIDYSAEEFSNIFDDSNQRAVEDYVISMVYYF